MSTIIPETEPLPPVSLRFSGLADEAGAGICDQIRAHRELGWEYIELRSVGGKPVTDIPEAAFDEVRHQLAEAGIRVSAVSSTIGNWATRITDPFSDSLAILERAIPRMHLLNTCFLRVMTSPNDGLSETEWRDESLRRLQALGRVAHEAGITLAVENCVGWANSSAENFARTIEQVGSPAVRALYDTGAPAAVPDAAPAWEWYRRVKPYLAYVHIKARTRPRNGEAGVHTWPDSGESDIEKTVRDLLASGYDGFVSIEPHLKPPADESGDEAARQDARYRRYVEYGTRFASLVGRIKGG